MNSTSTGTRFFGFAMAAIVTLAMLGGVESLAANPMASAHVAKACASTSV